MLKIRLRRIGAKFQPHYRIVVADSRSPRDGRFVSILGYYDPRTEPPTVHIDGAQVEDWARKGAQPTDAVIALLRQAKIAQPVIEAYQRKNPRKWQGGTTVDAVTPVAVATAAAAETADQPEQPEAPAPRARRTAAAAPAAPAPESAVAATPDAGIESGATDTVLIAPVADTAAADETAETTPATEA
ncbi:MAG TPA: 30S ribosomal protein S16 [Chloroflexia bacterium]|nr:30S ribosomal protein S16 [Chloroflexia bacterium]